MHLRAHKGVDIKKLCTSELRSCVNRNVGLGSHSLSQSSSVPNKPYGFCGHKAPWKKKKKMPVSELSSCVNREVVGLGPHSLLHSSPILNQPYSFCGCKAPWKKRLCAELSSCVNREVAGLGSLSFTIPFFPCP